MHASNLAFEFVFFHASMARVIGVGVEFQLSCFKLLKGLKKE